MWRPVQPKPHGRSPRQAASHAHVISHNQSMTTASCQGCALGLARLQAPVWATQTWSSFKALAGLQCSVQCSCTRLVQPGRAETRGSQLCIDSYSVGYLSMGTSCLGAWQLSHGPTKTQREACRQSKTLFTPAWLPRLSGCCTAKPRSGVPPRHQ